MNIFLLLHMPMVLREEKHILVVDDEPLLVRINKRQLENHGYCVSVSTESREALDLVRNNPGKYDLLLTDLTMPGMSGSDLIKKIRKQFPELPVIVLTGLKDEEIENELVELGVTAVVIKPVMEDELFRAVDSVFDEGRQ